jgi:hypothetical protein
MVGVLLGALFFVRFAVAGPPDWALHDTAHLHGNKLRVVCSGIGPSAGHARQEAIDSCKTSAAQHLNRNISVKTLSITSERQSAFQQEVSYNTQISGLVCVPKREEIEENDDYVRLWIECEFDLSRAQTMSRDMGSSETSGKNTGSSGSADLVLNRAELESIEQMPKGELSNDKVPERRVLSIAVIPMCADLIVSGDAPARHIRCDRNPISITIGRGDRSILVRADGYVSKSILLARSKDLRGYAKVVLAASR